MTINLLNTQIGYLTVTGKADRVYSGGSYRSMWKCLCICGKETIKRLQDLRSGRVKTCGCCEWHIHHNEAYVSWMAMKQRCNDSNRKDYYRYGGRGITYDIKWESFIEFFLDMGDPPRDNKGERMSLDRIDNNGNYNKQNCRWTDRSEQQGNKLK